MKVEFLHKFNKDLEKLEIDHVRSAALKAIRLVEKAKHFSEFPIAKNSKDINPLTVLKSEITGLGY